MMAFIDAANGLIWGKALIPLLLFTGLFFTWRTRFVQIRHFVHMFGVMSRSFQAKHGGISAFGAFTTSLAARVGTGNLAGVAMAIAIGGPGAVFWMWLVALIGSSSAFIESTLAQVYKVKDEDGTYRGGPAYYMEKGLGQRWMGILFSIFLIMAFGFSFNAIQSNTMSLAMQQAFNIPPLLSGLAIAGLTGVIIMGGIRRIAHFAEFVVPFMAIAYLIAGAIVVIGNIEELPAIFSLIIKSAFGLEANEIAGGGAGYAISQAMMNGIKRGLFSNEAGLGSAPNAAATADVSHPAEQGYVQMLGVFVDTIVICTCTASIILMSGMYTETGLGGIELTQAAFSGEVGEWGNAFIAVALLFFAFTSIQANYYYGETSLMFINENHKLLLPYRLAVLGMVVFGAVGHSAFVWNIGDLTMGLMALLNLVAIVALSKIAIKVMKDYNEQLKFTRDPVFDKTRYPELDHHISDDVW